MLINAPAYGRRFLTFIWSVTVLMVLAGCSLPSSNSDTTETEIGGAPVVRIVEPLPNQTYLENVEVNIQIQISNASTDITRVDFAVDNTVIASVQSPNAAGARVFSLTQTFPTQGIGQHTIDVVALREDGVSSEPASAVINVIEPIVPEDEGILSPENEDGSEANPTDDGSAQTAPTQETQVEAPTDAPPTDVPPSEEPAVVVPEVPMAEFTTGINVRRGPGTNFDPPIGQFAANTSAEILALNTRGDWLKVRYGSGEGWVFANLVTINGDTTNLPRESGPATPIPPPPPTATPIPATAAPVASANLVVVDHFLNPPVPACGQPVEMGMTIRNVGTTRSATGTGRIRVVRASDGAPIASTDNAFVSVDLDPNGGHRVTFTFNINVYVNELHRVEFIADVNNQVAETNENDNVQAVQYTLPPCQ